MKKAILALIIICLCYSSLSAFQLQQQTQRKPLIDKTWSDVNWKKVGFVALTAGEIGFITWLIKNELPDLGIGNLKSQGGSENYAWGVDKISHFYATYYATRLVSQLNKIFIKPHTSCFIGFCMSFTLGLLVEFDDGYRPYIKEGFSVDDQFANGLGCFWGLLTELYPEIDEYVGLKMSPNYRLTTSFGIEEMMNGLGPDFNRLVFWLVLKGEHILPEKINFFNFALGVCTVPSDRTENGVRKQFIISLDLELGKIFVPPSGPEIFEKAFNAFHIIMPEIRY